jgi:hypothetical protein
MLVRDGIATLVSRLVVYAAEEVASLGLATPLVVEQVATLCASWAAQIARWLKDLVSSPARLRGMAGKIAELIEKIKGILSKFRRKGGKDPVRRPAGPTREELLAELAANGVKHDPDKVILIGKDGDGKIVFLESGNADARLQHVMEHANQFRRYRHSPGEDQPVRLRRCHYREDYWLPRKRHHPANFGIDIRGKTL